MEAHGKASESNVIDSFLGDFTELCDTYSVLFMPRSEGGFTLVDSAGHSAECSVSTVRSKNGQTQTTVRIHAVKGPAKNAAS